MANYWVTSLFAGALLAVSTVPAVAQTDISIPAGQSWTHNHSGITLPATLAGIPRLNAKEFAAPGLDNSIGFGAAGTDVFTVFIFRDTNGSVPIWMAQAQNSILMRDDMGVAKLTVPTMAFTPPNQAANSGLKAIYSTPGHANITSTGVVMFNVNGWYVKVRATSFSKSAAELSTFMESAIREIRFPRGSGGAIQPIANCTGKLTFTAANAATSAGAAGVQSAAPTLRAANWCRELQMEKNAAVYRPVGTTDRYIMALGDNGNALVVTPQSGYYSENFFTASKTFTLTAMDKMPSPQRALQLIEDNAMVKMINSWPGR